MRNLLVIFLPFILFISYSCNFEVTELQKDKINPYSISLGMFKTYEQALKFKMKLSDSVRAHLRLESVGRKKYKLFYGKYPTAYMAGEKAFELYKKSLVKEYEINRNGQRVLDEFANVPFVANYLGKTSVFNYNLKTKTTEVLWSRSNGKVLSLNLAPNAKSVFIVTSEVVDLRSNFSSLQNTELHILHRNEDEAETLMHIGNVNQIYTYWDSPDTFRVNFTFPDSSNSRIIYQRIASWNALGKKGSITERSFDLLLQGFPAKPKNKPELYSPNGEYQLRITESGGMQYFYLKNFPDRSEILILATESKTEDIRWSPNSRYIFIKTIITKYARSNKIQSDEKEQIFVYDLNAKRIIKIIEGKGFENSLVRGKLLFFDEHLNGKNLISIVDLEDLTIFDSINLPGGCALNSLPE